MLFPTLRLNDKHKFVRQLKKYLNELVQPSPNLPDDDIFDKATVKAIAEFKRQWALRTKHTFSQLDGKYDADVYTWAFIGLALGSERLLRDLLEIKDYELRTLLLGINEFNVGAQYYTSEMEKCDAKIASILGGKNAIAAANGYEPEGLAVRKIMGFYRGDTRALLRDGKENVSEGHLPRHIMHLYGSNDGTRFGVDGKTSTDIYLPDGFETKNGELKQTPTATQAIVHFYYKELGKVKDLTILLMHVKGFNPKKQGNRWFIGQIGGKGGQVATASQPYLHSHFVLVKGDVGLGFNKGQFDDMKTREYRSSIGVRFIDAFC